jgi:predicted metal-dependent enzyme (double-stranded beta helix superfamily)
MTTVPSINLLSRADLVRLVANVAAKEALWRPRVVLPSGTERWWTQLSTDPEVDVWLLSWVPGQATDLHDHGDSAAAFSVVQGILTELRLARPSQISYYRREPGSVAWVAPGVIHDVHGAGVEPAVSIHAYSPALQRMTYYDAAGRAVRTVRTSSPEEEKPR